jgi:hypothetical protein
MRRSGRSVEKRTAEPECGRITQTILMSMSDCSAGGLTEHDRILSRTEEGVLSWTIKLWWGYAPLFRPMYAQAKMGHPSHFLEDGESSQQCQTDIRYLTIRPWAGK